MESIVGHVYQQFKLHQLSNLKRIMSRNMKESQAEQSCAMQVFKFKVQT